MDADILLSAVDTESPFHERSRSWMEDALNGSRRVALPWSSTSAFVRIATNPRALRQPLTPGSARSIVGARLDAEPVWSPRPGPGYRQIFGWLVTTLDLRANLVADAAIAALRIEHGLAVVSADSDFARFTEIEWINPVA